MSEDIKMYHGILEYHGDPAKKFVMTEAYMEGCTIGVKRLMAQNGNFLDFLYQDGSVEIRVLVASQCYGLHNLKNNNSWKVKLEVYNQTNFSFMDFENIHNEHHEIKALSVIDGSVSYSIFFEDCKTMIFLLEKHPFTQEQLTEIFNETKFKDVKIKAIMAGFDPLIKGDTIESYHRKNEVLTLLNDLDFVLECIKTNKFIELIIEKHKESSKIITELLKNGYAGKILVASEKDSEYDYCLNHYAFKYMESEDVQCALIDLGLFHIEFANTNNNENVIKNLINKTSSLSVLKIIASRCNKEMSFIAKLKLQEESDKEITKIFNLPLKVRKL
jgi:hypothetical protein